MIRIRKPAEPPAVLRERGPAATAEACAAVARGERPSFDSAIYGAAEVKASLRAAQHDKCCFCEAKIGHNHPGDVEHFRPKGRAQQAASTPSTEGYYWLACEWDNLYLSCEECNRRHKRGLFPLVNPAARVTSHEHTHLLSSEQPVFVDPGREDPAASIEFRREHAAAVDGNPRGTATRDALQLNRDRLVAHRRDRYQSLVLAVQALRVALADDHDGEVRRLASMALDRLISSSMDAGEYASMTRALLRQVAPWRNDWTHPAAALLDDLRRDALAGLSLHTPA